MKGGERGDGGDVGDGGGSVFESTADMIFVRCSMVDLFLLDCWIGYFYCNFLDILVNPCNLSKPGESV